MIMNISGEREGGLGMGGILEIYQVERNFKRGWAHHVVSPAPFEIEQINVIRGRNQIQQFHRSACSKGTHRRSICRSTAAIELVEGV
jgi:hypothetical protein